MGMRTCKNGNFVKEILCILAMNIFFCVYVVVKVFTHVLPGILYLSVCAYVCIVVEGIYSYKTGNVGN